MNRHTKWQKHEKQQPAGCDKFQILQIKNFAEIIYHVHGHDKPNELCDKVSVRWELFVRKQTAAHVRSTYNLLVRQAQNDGVVYKAAGTPREAKVQELIVTWKVLFLKTEILPSDGYH